MLRSISFLVGIGMVGFLAGCDGSSQDSGAAVDTAACEGVQAEIHEIEMGIANARETAWKYQDQLAELAAQLEKLGCAD